MEKFTVTKTVGGWVTVPADPQNCPLLTRLHRDEGDGTRISRRLDWDSLEDGLARIRNAAARLGMTVQVCGDIRRRPTVILREKPLEPEPIDVFAGMGGDAAKWGVSDFYDEKAGALRKAIAGRQPFDTRWYGVKKEIQSGRVRRVRRGGPIEIEVSCCMDEGRDLVDTAFWIAAGRTAGSGWDVLAGHGLSEEAIDALIDEVARDMGLGEDNCAHRARTLHWRSGFETVCAALDTAASEADAELEAWLESVIADCRERLEALRKR